MTQILYLGGLQRPVESRNFKKTFSAKLFVL